MLNEDGISWSTRFTNTLCLKGKLWPNDYRITFNFVPLVSDAKKQNLVFEKYKYCFHRVFQNSLFIKYDNEAYNKLKVFDNFVIDFVHDPYDQLVGVQIFSKLNAIGEGLLKVEAMHIESWQGENLQYVITNDSPEWEILHDLEKTMNNHWWKNNSPHFSTFTSTKATWDEVGFTASNEPVLHIIQGGRMK